MRGTVITAGVLLIASLLFAVETAWSSPKGAEPVSPKVRQIARQYATQLRAVLDPIRAEYVREVSEAESIRAAIIGLYEAAREPLPASLDDELRQAEEKDALGSLVERLRASLGDREELQNNRDLVASLRTLPRALDPFCGLIPSSELTGAPPNNGLGFELEGFEGSPVTMLPHFRDGTNVTLRSQQRVPLPWRVKTVIPGGPAQRAGLQPGDLITHFDGQAVTAETSPELFTQLLQPTRAGPGNEDQSVELTVRRSGVEEPISITAAKGFYETESVFGVRRLPDHSWDYWLDREAKIGHIRLAGIDRETPAQMVAAVQTLEADGVRGLILDLRWCPGGYLNPAIELAGIFLPKGLIAKTEYRNPARVGEEFRVEGGLARFQAGHYPLVVLVNGATSGGGELIAAALQDHGRGVIVGQRTRGKASVQSPIDIPVPGYAFKLTQGTFLRPSGKNLQRFPDSTFADEWGVRPEPRSRFALSKEVSDRLEQWWEQQTLRPGPDRTALPLDDPDHDPQRKFAVGILRHLIQKAGPEESEPETHEQEKEKSSR